MPGPTIAQDDSGKTLVLVNGQWAPAEATAAHEDGTKAYYAAGQWIGADAKSAPPAPRGPVGKAADAVGGFLQGVGDAGATLTSGAVAGPVSGLVGAGQAVTNAYRTAGHAIAPSVVDAPTVTAADAQENADQALTYQPRTRGGREYVEAITSPLRLLAAGGDKAGAYVAEKTGSPALGAGVNTAIQMAPGLIEPGLRAGRAALRPRPVEPPPVAPPGGGAAPGAPPAPLTASDVPRGTMTPVEPTPRPLPAAGAPGTPGEIPKPRPPPTEAETRAADYARNRLGVDWDSLAPKFKETLTSIATDAKRLDSLPVEAVRRQAQLQSLRVPITTTRGRLLRDEAATRREANVSATDAGKPIRDIDTQANRDLRANVEGLRTQVGGVGKTKATAGNTEEVGSATHEALRGKEAVSIANYNELYRKARETDPEATTSTQAIQDLAKKNPAIQHLQWVPSWFKRAAGAEGLEAIDQVKLSDLQDLREQAGGIARAGGTDGFHAGQVVKAIDQAMEEGAPNAAAAWKAAQKAFREHKGEFEDTNAVERIVGDKSRNDPKTALEDTWKRSVQTAKLEEIRQLKRSLLSGGNAETRLAGKKALRELRQETVNQYLRYITRKTGTNEAGETEITAVQMVEGLKHVGGEARLTEIIGRRAVKELKNVIEAAKIAKTEPTKGGRSAGSSTMQNILNSLEKWGGKIGGNYVAGAVGVVRKLGEIGAEGRTVREAVSQPTDKAEGSIKSKIRRDKIRRGVKFAGENLLRKARTTNLPGGMTLRDDTDLGK